MTVDGRASSYASRTTARAPCLPAASRSTSAKNPATGITIADGRVRTVHTPRDEVATGHVVIAAGPWARAVGRLAGLDLPVVPSRESVLTLRPSFEAGRHPVTADLVNEVYLRPETGNLLLAGSTRDTEAPGDPDDYEDRPDPAFSTDLAGRLARLMPPAAEAGIAGGWSGMYEVSPDWNPIMGTAAAVAGLHYAVGFSGHGFKLSPVVGRLMAEQVADGRATTLDIAPYRLERFVEGKMIRPAYPGAGVIG